MKQAEVVVGATVIARVSGELRPVEVVGTAQIRVGSWSQNKFITGFRLRDKRSGRDLPNARRAASLRHTNGSHRAALVIPAIVAGLCALHAS